MDSKVPTVYFSGDLSDPWVADIAGAIADFQVIQCEGEGSGIPSRPFEASDPAKVLILHRSRLSTVDVERLAELHRALGAENWPRIALCLGPYARYAEIERVAGLVEFILPEATASETLPRRLALMLGAPVDRPPRPEAESPIVEVVSSDFDLRRVLADACHRAGYRAVESSSLSDSHHRAADSPALTVWDVPVLEPRWAEHLERRSRSGPVVALLGFADRGLVALARKSGASACLDLPCEMDDLIHVLDQLASSASASSPIRFQTPHATPPPPVGRAGGGGSRGGRRSAPSRLKLDDES